MSFKTIYFCQVTEEEGENQAPEAGMRRTGAIFYAEAFCVST